MNLSNRLKEIIKLVPKNSIVADIGTDHGQIPVYLIENKISKRVIATDISKPSLDKTIDLIEERKLEDKILTKLGDGLEVLRPFQVDTVIMAGMGGILITEILESNRKVTDSISHFIFQPMVASKELRQYLVENQFKIVDESLAREGERFYEIILAKKGPSTIEKDIYYELGPKLIEKNHPLLRTYIEKKISQLNNIKNSLKKAKDAEALEKKRDIIEKIKAYREVLETIES